MPTTAHARIRPGENRPVVTWQPLHLGQQRIVANLGQKNLLRCGRRFGKTTLLEEVFSRRAIRLKRQIGWFTPQYKLMTPTYVRFIKQHGGVVEHRDKVAGLITFKGGGSIEFWTLDDEDAGRSRAYDDVVVDEASLKAKGLKEVVEQAIMPTLIDRDGTLTLAGTPKGIDEESYFYLASTDKTLGFREFHAPTWLNPNLSPISVARLKLDHPPLVYQQEFCAEFVDWSGEAFFSVDSLTENGEGVADPIICDGVFLFIDSATKTGKENDGTGALLVAYQKYPSPRVWLLDWDLVQIEGALLEHWLPGMMELGEYWSEHVRARMGFQGALIEDKSSGMILLQQAHRRGMKAQAIDSVLTEMGKQERALNVSGYVYRRQIKATRHCWDKVVRFKGVSANHLRRQVVGFRMGVKDQVEDDLLDCFCYAGAVCLGDAYGF
jgi:hypothetical protein